jgi:hypothetical protein
MMFFQLNAVLMEKDQGRDSVVGALVGRALYRVGLGPVAMVL